MRQLSQPTTYALGLDELILGGVLRYLRKALLDGYLVRQENLLMAEYQTFEHDVLVIGAGGAGLRAAIEASAAGVSVGLVCKSLLGKAHTVMAEGGIAAALANVDDRDNWKVHFADTMRGGQYVNNWRMAELHAREAPDRVRELEAWGAVFDRTADGRILQRNFGGHKYPRLAHVGDRTGLEMIRTLQDHGIHQGIDVHMECTVLTLLTDAGRVVGAFAYERERGRFRLFKAKAIVLATGGIGRAYRITSNSWEYTGDGHALAYHAGAELIDMEFVQFHPTGMVWPPSVRGILVTEGVRGEGGVLLNSMKKRFMFQEIPDNYKSQTADNEEEGWRYTQGDKSARRPPELLTRDHVARCIVREVKEGRGSPHGGVYLDISWIKERLPKAEEHIKRKLPSMYHQFKQLADIDITQQPMEVGPTTHYIMGGIRVDADTQMSCVSGLFAAGECAAGINGANRLGGNSLSDLLVFGKRAGEFAAKFARQQSTGQIDNRQLEESARRAVEPFERSDNADALAHGPYTIQRELQEMMQDLVGIVRTEDEMQRALEGIGRLWERASRVAVTGNREYNPGWHTALDLTNLLTVSEAITRSAIERRESRGAQFREDYPSKDPAFANINIMVKQDTGGTMKVSRVPIPEMREELKQVIQEMG
jgi:succinate dehydrogenase / fumarate reductase flavoprotein subunit